MNTERKIPLSFVKVTRMCTQCILGQMEYTDCYTLDGRQYQHQCNKCGNIKYFSRKYPVIEEKEELFSEY